MKVVDLCMLSDHALYLCQVSWNYLEQYQSYGADTNDQPLTDERTDGWTDTQKFGGYNIIPSHFLWRGTKNIIFWGWGGGGWGATVSKFFFTKNPNLKKKI